VTLLFVAGALFAVLAIAEIAARFVGSHRTRPFRQNGEVESERSRIPALVVEYGLVDAEQRAMKPDRFDEAQLIVDQTNRKAGLLQRDYQEAIARCSWSAGFALILACLSVTLLKDNREFQAFAASVEVFAIVYALIFISRARFVNRKWVRQRSLAELLRIWLHLDIVLKNPSREVNGHKPEVIKEVAESLHREVTGDVSFGDLHRKIERHWMKLKSEYEWSALREPSDSGILPFYLLERPVYQLSYFIGAQERLGVFHTGRGRFMFSLYIVSAVFAVLGAAVAFKNDLPAGVSSIVDLIPQTILDWNALGLLLGLIISVVLTSLYLGRNDRSLAHRYRAQERRIRNWLKDYHVFFFDHAKAAVGDVAIKQSILSFEELMVDELLDWIHITSRDVIDVGG
jgi:hypothetical protein